MILRRLADAIRRQDWFTVLMETAIVITGVFLGLQAQQWAKDREDRQTEAVYLTRLYDEVLDLEATRAPLLALREGVFESVRAVTPALFGSEQRALKTQECDSLGLLSIVSNPTSDLATLLELQETGRLSLFQDEIVRSAIRSYLLKAARARDINAAVFRNIAPLMPDYPELLRYSKTANPGITSKGFIVCDVSEIRNNIEF